MNEELAGLYYLLYDGISEAKAREIYETIRRITDNDIKNFDKTRRVLLEQSCLTHSIRKVVYCNCCKKWQNTNHMFCPACSKDPSFCDWEKCRLVKCDCPSCVKKENNPTIDKRSIVCNHLSQCVKKRYIVFFPPEAMIAEYFRSGVAFGMFGTLEDEIVKEVQNATALQYHNVLFSKNAMDVYRGVGWNKAADAVKAYLDMKSRRSSMTVLEETIPDVKSCYQSFKEKEAGNSPLMLLITRTKGIRQQLLSTTCWDAVLSSLSR